SLDSDSEGALHLARAFEPATPRPPNEPEPPPGRGVRVALPNIAIGHIWVHGQMKGAPIIDADADAVHGQVAVNPIAGNKTGITIDVDKLHLAARALPNGANPHGDVTLHVALPSARGKDMGLEASFGGDVGGIPMTARASMDGERIDAVADVPHASSSQVRALVPNVPLNEDASVHAEAHGDLPHLATSAQVKVGKGTLHATGDITLGPTMSIEIAAEARHIDAHAFSDTHSDLSADLKASVKMGENGAPQGTYTLRLAHGTAAGQRVPAVRLGGQITASTITARGQVNEPGAPTDVSLTFHHQGKEPTVQFDVHTRLASLARIQRVGPVAEGSADVHANGTIALGRPSIDAHVEVHGKDIQRDDMKLESVTVEGRLSGPLANPFIDARLNGRELSVAGRHFRRANAQARGPVTAPVVAALLHGEPGSPRLEAEASLAFGDGITMRNVRLAVIDPAATVETRAERIHIGKGGVTAENTVVYGLGEPAAFHVQKTREGLRIQVHAKGIDIGRVARLVKFNQEDVRGGTVDADVELLAHRKGVDGTVVIAVNHAAIGPLKDGNAQFHGTFAGKQVTLALHAETDATGLLDINTSTLQLPGSPLDVAAWKHVTGKMHLDTRAHFERLAALLPASFPVEPTNGIVALEADVGRDSPDDEADVSLSVQTRDLAMTGKRPREFDAKGVEVVTPPPWHLAGVDFGFDANIDGKTGTTQITTSATSAADANTPLVALKMQSSLPYRDLVQSVLASQLTRVQDLIERAPLALSLEVPKRSIASLPELLGVRGYGGDVALNLNVAGTVRDPHLAFEARVHDLKPAKALHQPAVSSRVTARYDAGEAQAGVHVRLPEGEVATATLSGHGRFIDVLHPPKGEPAWDASAHVHIARFPLESIPSLSDRQVQGHLSGDIQLSDLHRAGAAHAQITIHDLRVGRAVYTAGQIALDVDDNPDKNVRASVRLEQSDGFAKVSATARANWGTRMAPALDATKPIQAEIKAVSFRAAALLPFAEPHLSELDGRLDADTRMTLAPTAGSGRSSMEGTVSLRDGTIEIPTMGERLSGLRAAVRMDKDGLVHIDGIEARTDEGRVQGDGTVRLDGLAFVGANASFRIARKEALPISLSGQEIGTTYGNLDLKAAMTADRKTMNVDVDIPSMHIEIPDRATHNVLDLDRAEKIRVGVYQAHNEFTVLPLGPQDLEAQESKTAQPTKMVIKVNLGRDVVVRRGTDISVQLEGEPTVTINSETKMSGQIRLLSGYLDVQGKKFEIETGTVTFTGPANNPTADITAGWTAPEGTRVYANFIGPIKTGKVNLRSEPAHSKSEIFAIIMYGSDPSGDEPSSQGADTSTQIAGVGGGLATQGLNKAIRGLTGSDFATVRVDTSNSANPRPEIEFQIARSISLQLATVFGRLPIDQPDRNFATVDWRFRRNWSVQTTVGDQGSTTVDLVWQKRY
ncbi:MAG TPA: translocation/assembly module TamB domain-containing protein, partial [Polyangiaceae bacterium]|nr:translocation/assembly module TamB domain-containing protein [Polyangiaceae bacterium]